VVDPRLGRNANLGQMAVGLARQGEERRGEEGEMGGLHSRTGPNAG
jgi:hypothetical protein